MSLELLKVIVQPVILERDPDGCIIGERLAEPHAIYDLAQLADYIEAIREQLAEQQKELRPAEQ